MERALIVQKKWLDLIFSKSKTWEMRSQKTKIRGEVGLIESGSGLVVGSVTISDSLDALNEHEYFEHTKHHGIIINDNVDIKKWCYPWVLSNPTRFFNPIHYAHPRGAVVWVRLKNI